MFTPIHTLTDKDGKIKCVFCFVSNYLQPTHNDLSSIYASESLLIICKSVYSGLLQIKIHHGLKGSAICILCNTTQCENLTGLFDEASNYNEGSMYSFDLLMFLISKTHSHVSLFLSCFCLHQFPQHFPKTGIIPNVDCFEQKSLASSFFSKDEKLWHIGSDICVEYTKF